MRIGLRARSHIDKLFADGAKKKEKYSETVMLNISQGKKPRQYQQQMST